MTTAVDGRLRNATARWRPASASDIPKSHFRVAPPGFGGGCPIDGGRVIPPVFRGGPL